MRLNLLLNAIHVEFVSQHMWRFLSSPELLGPTHGYWWQSHRLQQSAHENHHSPPSGASINKYVDLYIQAHIYLIDMVLIYTHKQVQLYLLDDETVP